MERKVCSVENTLQRTCMYICVLTFCTVVYLCVLCVNSCLCVSSFCGLWFVFMFFFSVLSSHALLRNQHALIAF